jgi:anti-repressor protein
MESLIPNQKGMTSLEIAEVTGKQHAHVMRDIRNLLSQGVAESNFGLGSYTDANGQERPLFNLTPKGCLILASGYDVVLREKIIDRLEYLENEKKAIRTPQTYLEALKALVSSEEEKQRLELEVQKKEQEKQSIIEETKPAVVFTECVTSSSTNILIGDLAKLITQNGYKIGEIRLYEWMVENKFLIRKQRYSKSKNKYVNDYMPTQRAAEMGLFFVKEKPIVSGGSPIFIKHTCYVTGKGQVYFLNKFKSLMAA